MTESLAPEALGTSIVSIRDAPVLPTVEQPAPKRSRKAGPLLSVLLHVVGVAVLFSLPKVVETSLPAIPSEHVVLVAPMFRRATPLPPVLPVAKPRHVAVARPIRLFRAPEKVVAPAVLTIAEAPSAPIAVAAPPVPHPEMPVFPVSKPQPKLGTFTETPVESAPVVRQAVPTSGGFGDGAIRVESKQPKRAIARGGFSDTVVESSTARARAVAPRGSDALQILNKPRPEYTEQARRLNIQGEVLLEAVFLTTGEIQVVRLIRGLGHGLDENAVAAARKIRFEPARSHGTPVDSTATIHIQFELTY